MPGVYMTPSIPGALASGSLGVCSVDSEQEMSSAIRGLGLWKKNSPANICEERFCLLLRWSASAFIMPCQDESRNPLRTSGIYLIQVAASTAGHMWLIKFSPKISHMYYSLFTYIHVYFIISYFIFISIHSLLIYIKIHCFNYISGSDGKYILSSWIFLNAANLKWASKTKSDKASRRGEYHFAKC